MVAVRSWDAGTGTLTLFLPALYPIQTTNPFTIHPGCDKTFPTRKAKFVVSLTSRATTRSSVILIRRVEP